MSSPEGQTAAGGWCAPATMTCLCGKPIEAGVAHTCDMLAGGGHVDLSTLGVRRGGIQWPQMTVVEHGWSVKRQPWGRWPLRWRWVVMHTVKREATYADGERCPLFDSTQSLGIMSFVWEKNAWKFADLMERIDPSGNDDWRPCWDIRWGE